MALALLEKCSSPSQLEIQPLDLTREAITIKTMGNRCSFYPNLSHFRGHPRTVSEYGGQLPLHTPDCYVCDLMYRSYLESRRYQFRPSWNTPLAVVNTNRRYLPQEMESAFGLVQLSNHQIVNNRRGIENESPTFGNEDAEFIIDVDTIDEASLSDQNDISDVKPRASEDISLEHLSVPGSSGLQSPNIPKGENSVAQYPASPKNEVSFSQRTITPPVTPPVIHRPASPPVNHSSVKAPVVHRTLTPPVGRHPISPPASVYICPEVHFGSRRVCGKVCNTVKDLKNHQSRQRNVDSGRYVCEFDYCRKRFGQKSTLKQHELIHTGERPFHCDKCKRKFTDSSTFTKHVRTHTGDKPYGCSNCGRRFTQSGNMKRHERSKTCTKRPSLPIQ